MPFEKGKIPEGATPFQPGQSGNPAGYPPGVPNRGTILKRLLAQKMTYTDPTTQEEVEGTVEEAMNWGIISKATSGDTAAFKEVLDSVYGKQTEKLEVDNTRKITRRIGGRTPPPDDAQAGT
ncbi:DUF5681 domain-containing protein [Hymenobacter tenuis]